MLKKYFEAVAEQKSGRVVDILKSRIERKFDEKVYVQHGTMLIEKQGEGVVYGTMFMLDDAKHAFRLNWKTNNQSTHIDSIDFWLSPAVNPQFTANTSNLSIAEVVTLIDEVLNNGKKGKVTLITIADAGDEEVPFHETTDFFEMARTPDPNSLSARYKKAKEAGDTALMKQLSAEYRAQKSGKVVNVTSAPSEQLAAKEPDEWSDLFDEPLNAKEIFSLMEDAIKKVKAGTNKSILITGDPGIGKTYTVKQELKGVNHQFFTGAITSASALYKVLFINNDPDKIIVFDDLDSLLDDRDCVNMLKGALDSGKETEIAYLSNNTVPPLFYETILKYDQIDDIPEEVINQLLKQKIDISAMLSSKNAQAVWDVYRLRASSPTKGNAILPNRFNFDGRVIFISNKYLHQIPGAIKSRAMTVEISLSLDEIVKRIEGVMPHMEITGASEAHKREALKFIKDKVVPSKRVEKMDFRTFTDIVKFAVSDAPTNVWQRWAAVSIMQKYASGAGRKGDKR